MGIPHRLNQTTRDNLQGGRKFTNCSLILLWPKTLLFVWMNPKLHIGIVSHPHCKESLMNPLRLYGTEQFVLQGHSKACKTFLRYHRRPDALHFKLIVLTGLANVESYGESFLCDIAMPHAIHLPANIMHALHDRCTSKDGIVFPLLMKANVSAAAICRPHPWIDFLAKRWIWLDNRAARLRQRFFSFPSCGQRLLASSHHFDDCTQNVDGNRPHPEPQYL
jgi:hypothetical protein